MLSLPSEQNKHVRYQPITNPKLANRLFSTVSCIEKIAMDDLCESVLVLYAVRNSSGMYESAIYYGPGPLYRKKEEFPSEMIRGFSRGRECFDVMIDHYIQLVRDHSFDHYHNNKIH